MKPANPPEPMVEVDADEVAKDVEDYIGHFDFEDSGSALSPPNATRAAPGGSDRSFDNVRVDEMGIRNLLWDGVSRFQKVHADLATRKITEDKTTKISDFGLSRKLYASESYVKKQIEGLPWRWMSPESCRQLEFNEKTDVWAYGITLWEIFSFGEVPYAGFIWAELFLRELETGFRLDKPRYDDNNLFPLMSRCWNLDRNRRRPTFLELKAHFEEADFTSVT